MLSDGSSRLSASLAAGSDAGTRPCRKSRETSRERSRQQEADKKRSRRKRKPGAGAAPRSCHKLASCGADMTQKSPNTLQVPRGKAFCAQQRWSSSMVSAVNGEPSVDCDSKNTSRRGKYLASCFGPKQTCEPVQRIYDRTPPKARQLVSELTS